MKKYSKLNFILMLLFSILCHLFCSGIREKTPAQLNQYPSPMVEFARAHERLSSEALPGMLFQIDSLFAKPMEIFLPDKIFEKKSGSLLIHFHGASYVAKNAICQASLPFVLANLNLGSGSSKYEQPFLKKEKFSGMIKIIEQMVATFLVDFKKFDKIIISAFSAGYGAVRAIIYDAENVAGIDGIILLDGLHTDYIPDRLVLAEGGKLNADKLKDFQSFAELAAQGKKKFLIAHSEIFPGTYASTTETADYLIKSLSLKRTAVLKWGPMGMQQISEVRQTKFWVFGYAGNSAPDHVDFLHGLPFFLNFMLEN